MTPFHRLVSQRPDADALYGYIRRLERPLEIAFNREMGETDISTATCLRCAFSTRAATARPGIFELDGPPPFED
jgi:hypothetical protein